jgi:hypothetical protein
VFRNVSCADEFAVVGLFWLVALLLAACGLGLLGVGAGMMAEGSIGAGLLGAACGMLVTYGSYLFGRAAMRMRTQLRMDPLDPVERRARRANVWQVLSFAAAIVIGDLLVPGPTGVRVVAVICALFVVPLILVVDFEPPKK